MGHKVKCFVLLGKALWFGVDEVIVHYLIKMPRCGVGFLTG
jgi:hypothetical protein